ncbi:hypothetical protein SMD44_00760 [Streptomyces alboflavus]|uniref:Uncharacterized protein n=2 Tax=Streptomyces alboflavus TaxID=67267 RepID=A0A1Z1W4N6_9ACTN|nr:hypothetical protein SMD44_00760 [Streptomyces alboflavus]
MCARLCVSAMTTSSRAPPLRVPGVSTITTDRPAAQSSGHTSAGTCRRALTRAMSGVPRPEVKMTEPPRAASCSIVRVSP